MRYISLFSGIEAASVAWEGLGWEPVAFSEIEPFCCDLLQARFPNVPNLGDISSIDWKPYEGSADVIIGGSPCQAFSVAGRRGGLMDERGQLMLEFVRAVREVRPRWVVWENVPGVLSQDGGRAFATLHRELLQCGYSLAWRVLDAQFFGVPQRRRRVFLIGHPRVGCAAGVLFEPDCLRWDNPPSRRKREELAARAGRYLAGAGGDGSFVMPMKNDTTPKFGEDGDPAFTLRRGGDGGCNDLVCTGPRCGQGAGRGAVRRYTPVECERLQGFPGKYTDIPYRGKEHPPDTPRYKALGNSFAVPVVRWIGERIQMAEEGPHEHD